MDKTPPQNLLIFVIGVISVITLMAVAPGFRAYYDGMHRGAMADRQARFDDTERLTEVQAAWARGLDEGRMPIDEAMTQLAERGRTRIPQIQPRPSGEMNLDPLTGWNQLPQALPDSVADAQAAAAAAAEEAARLEALQPAEGEEVLDTDPNAPSEAE